MDKEASFLLPNFIWSTYLIIGGPVSLETIRPTALLARPTALTRSRPTGVLPPALAVGRRAARNFGRAETQAVGRLGGNLSSINAERQPHSFKPVLGSLRQNR